MKSLDFAAEKMGACHSTIFHMRHKLIVYIETAVIASEPLKTLIETDRIYELESNKGTRVAHRRPRKYEEGFSKRDLSSERFCTCVSENRTNYVVARCANRPKLGSENLADALAKNITEKSVFLCVGATSYNYLAEKINREKIPLVGHESYNKV